ncbi:hypothetical protein J3R08_005995 [Micromonospora sp. HB375]|nr:MULTISPECIES: hypothetical protein [unclassified Micromonospora]MBP1786145.1 hypothetical protein [Micromonospora sp. HB375]MDH6471810.1 hypothetical protein [Micromonospora sp. H404/HB375]
MTPGAAIVAFDFSQCTLGSAQTPRVIDWAKLRNGIVAFLWHAYCPRGGN